MKISTVDYHGSIRSGIVKDGPDGPVIELFAARTDSPWIVGISDLKNIEREPSVPLSSCRLLPPVPKPGKLLCLAGNYREHIVESGYAAPETEDVLTQQVFLKPSTCLIGSGAEIPIGAA